MRSNGAGTATVALPGTAPVPADRAQRVDYFDVGPGFLATLRAPMIAGREFSEHDTPSTPPVALVNEALAKRLWGSTDAVGRSVLLDGRTFQVVGVVKDYRPHAFGDSPRATAYVAYWQSAFAPQVDANLAIRVEGDPLRALADIRRALQATDPNVPVTELASMQDQMRSSYAELGLGRIVLVTSAALTLFLAAVGLYGVVSYLVTQRAREIAVRLAIGARPGEVVGMLLRQGLRPIAVGSAIGLIATIGAAPLLSRWLFGIAPIDVATIVAALGAVMFAALVASYLPARRAAATDPAAVFRAD